MSGGDGAAKDLAPRFGRWQPLERLEAAPAGPAVLQLKVQGRLLDYERGRSAMLWYGLVEGARPAEVAAAAVAGLPGAIGSEDDAVWRILYAPDAASRYARLVGSFERRFGGPPVLNREGGRERR